jgi:hypothetical protein
VIFEPVVFELGFELPESGLKEQQKVFEGTAKKCFLNLL